MKSEKDAHAAMSQTAKMRCLDVMHGEITRERRKNLRGSHAAVLTDQERKALLSEGALAADPTEYKTP